MEGSVEDHHPNTTDTTHQTAPLDLILILSAKILCFAKSHILHVMSRSVQLASVTCVPDSPEEVLIGGMDFSHCLPLLCGPPSHAGGQNGHDVIGETGGAGVSGGQHVDVGEPVGGLSSVPLAHQEDTERQQGRETAFPAAERTVVTDWFILILAPSLAPCQLHLRLRFSVELWQEVEMNYKTLLTASLNRH